MQGKDSTPKAKDAFFCKIENWMSTVPTRLNKMADGSAIWLPGTTGQVSLSSSAHIHIVPSLHSPLSLNVSWLAYRYAYQIKPHSTSNTLHTSPIIRHVFQHPAPTCTHINIHSVTADNWEIWTLLYIEADSKGHICFSRAGGVFLVSWHIWQL